MVLLLLLMMACICCYLHHYYKLTYITYIYTLDLVLCCGLSVADVEICDSVFSDHMPVLLSTVAQFSTIFDQNSVVHENVFHDINEHSSWLHSTCQTVLALVAPLKQRIPKTKIEPWLNETTHTVRQQCRRAERKLFF